MDHDLKEPSAELLSERRPSAMSTSGPAKPVNSSDTKSKSGARQPLEDPLVKQPRSSPVDQELHQHHHQRPPNTSATINTYQPEKQANKKLINQNLSYPCCCCPAELRGHMSPSISFISACFLAELVGTFLLVLIGDGTIAAYVVTKRQPDTLTTCLGFGVAAMIATFTTARISGAHLNPCASLAQAIDGKLKWSLVPVYMVAQYLGGFLAALVLFINNCEAINALDGGNHSAFGSANSTAHIFTTFPGPWVSPWGSLLDQIIGTAILLFSLSAMSDKRNLGLDDRHQPVGVALIVCIVCVAFSPNCGAIFNPARDLGPRLLTSLVGYPDVWKPVDGLYWILAGLIGPHIGALLGYFAYKFLVGSSLDCVTNHQLKQHQLASHSEVNKQRTLEAPFKHHQYYLRQQQHPPEPLSHSGNTYTLSELSTEQRATHVHKMSQ